MKPLTVFTPTFNSAHTLRRLYESLVTQSCPDFEWLVIDNGSTDFTRRLVEGFRQEGRIHVTYIHQEHGGPHTVYAAAYANISTELCVCIDADNFMPEDAVETILSAWQGCGSPSAHAGLIGLNCHMETMETIGRPFPDGMNEAYFPNLYSHGFNLHNCTPVTRTDLMRAAVIPSECDVDKDLYFLYSLLHMADSLPVLTVNACFSITDTQVRMDTRTQESIFRKYADSPHSFAALRHLEMRLKHTSLLQAVRSALHYVAIRLYIHLSQRYKK